MAAESKPPVQPGRGNQDESDRLLEPDNLKLARYLRSGGKVNPPINRILTLEPSYAAKIHDQVKNWLKDGDFESLAKSLESDSLLFSHDIVYHQIRHLRYLLSLRTHDDFFAENASAWPPEQQEPLPIETQRAARAILERLVRALVKGILPQYVVEPVKHRKRRGAPGTDDGTRIHWLMEFNRMREELLTQEGADAAAVAPKRGGTRTGFIRRLARLVQKVYAASSYCWDRKDYRDDEARRVDPFGRTCRKVPLPEMVALAIAKQATSKTMRVSKNTILYGLLAHIIYKNWTNVTKARRLIERAEEDFPDYDERGHRGR